jgi:DNA replication protein DnaC
LNTDAICPKCHGTGWLLEDSGGGTRAKRCSCYDERERRSRLDLANIPRRYRDCSFESYKLSPNDKESETLAHALKISKAFVKNYPGQDIGLLFIGPCGVGKTHLAVSIIRELILHKGASCVFYDFRDLIREIQSTFTPDSTASETAVLAPVFSCDVLVLDELGAKRTTAWVEETVFYIINQRYNQKKVTIFTTNYPDIDEPEDNRESFYKKGGDNLVDRIGVRLRSRIYEMCKVVPMEGKDFRREIKQASYRF